MSDARRQIINVNTTQWLEYDLEGPLQREMRYLPLSFDRGTGCGTYIMRMHPGAETLWHEHSGMEEYYILEGDVVESDGTVLGPGDFVIYQPGTEHNSRTVGGCTLLVFEWRRAT